MLKFSGFVAAAAMALTIPSYAATAQALGPGSAVCAANGSAVLVNIAGLKARTGTIRVNLYANNSKTYLEKGKYLQRVEVAVPKSGNVAVCLPVKAGTYAISVRHDRNGNHKSDMSDGGGFSGNPKVSVMDAVLKRKPSLGKTAFSVGNDTKQITVTMRYAS